MVRQYIGARYVPKFFENPDGSNDWLPNVQYEPITVVTYAGNSYTSKKNVPATIGNPTEAPEYWASTGIYNAQIDIYRQEVADLKDFVDDHVSYYHDKNILILGDSLSDEGLSMSAPNWVTYFRDEVVACGGSVTNYSQSGRTLSNVRADNLIAHLGDIPSGDYTDIILFLGTNDWGDGASWQQLLTACGSFIDWKNTNHPDAKVYVVTPLKDDKTQFNTTSPVVWYRNALIKILCSTENYLVIDAYNGAPNFNANKTFSKNRFSVDGVHFAPLYAPIFADFIYNAIPAGGTGAISTLCADKYTRDLGSGVNAVDFTFFDDGRVNMHIYLNNFTPSGSLLIFNSVPEAFRPAVTFSSDAYCVKGGQAKSVTIKCGADGTFYLICGDTARIDDCSISVTYETKPLGAISF